MAKIYLFLFASNKPSDIYLIKKIVDLKNISPGQKTEVYAFLNPYTEFSIWKEWFTETIKIMNPLIDISIHNGFDLFFEQSTKNACLMKKFSGEFSNLRFYKIFYPWVLKGYLSAHREADDKIFIFCSSLIKGLLKDLKLPETKITVFPKEFETLTWKGVLQEKELFGNLNDKVKDIYYLWKKLHFNFLGIETKEEVKHFLNAMSNSVRQEIFYATAENNGITARKIQNYLRSQGNTISLPAILKHLNELCALTIIEKKDKLYYPRFKRVKITLTRD